MEAPTEKESIAEEMIPGFAKMRACYEVKKRISSGTIITLHTFKMFPIYCVGDRKFFKTCHWLWVKLCQRENEKMMH